MKILLLGINARWTHTNLALYYLRQYVDTTKHTAQILEKTINDYVWDILQEIHEYSPDVLCLSAYIWNQSHIQAILREIKKLLPNLIIVCGGPDISYNTMQWLERFPAIDFIIVGGGEKAFETLQSNDFTPFENVVANDYPPLQHYGRGKIISIPNYTFSDIQMPYTIEDKVSLRHRYVYYEASRGCAFRCSYCLSSTALEALQFKTFDQIRQELDTLLTIEPIIVKFIDRTFNIDNELAIAIWKYLSDFTGSTKFHFEIHPNFITDEQIDVLKKVKRDTFQFEIGVQSVKAETMRLVNRHIPSEKVASGLWRLEIAATELRNIHQHLDLIAGLPNETFADIKVSFNECIKLRPDHLQLGFLKILPGTSIASETDKWGYKYQETAPYRVFCSNTISINELYLVEQVETALELTYNSKLMTNLSREIIATIKDPFDYFLSLGIHLKNHNINKTVTDKKTIFHSIYLHFQSNYSLFIIHHSLIKDCMVFDWFLSANTHYYPEFLEATHCDHFKETIYKSFKELYQSITADTIPEMTPNHHKPKLRNAIYFTPQTEEFRSKYLSNAVGAVIIDKHTLYFVYKEGDRIKICKQ